MSVLWFNLFFLFCYYFRIIEFFDDGFLFENKIFNVLFLNFLVAVFDVFLMFFLGKFIVENMSYFAVVIVSFFIGFIISFIFFKTNYKFSDYLFVVSFVIINDIFMSYSLKFEREKNDLFS